jgi:hypothetical protein
MPEAAGFRLHPGYSLTHGKAQPKPQPVARMERSGIRGSAAHQASACMAASATPDSALQGWSNAA